MLCFGVKKGKFILKIGRNVNLLREERGIAILTVRV